VQGLELLLVVRELALLSFYVLFVEGFVSLAFEVKFQLLLLFLLRPYLLRLFTNALTPQSGEKGIFKGPKSGSELLTGWIQLALRSFRALNPPNIVLSSLLLQILFKIKRPWRFFYRDLVALVVNQRHHF